MSTEAELFSLYLEFQNKIESYISNVKYSSSINLKLERITHLLELLDNPHYAYDSIHVGGTSGKGSTCTIISNILQTLGYKTGMHTSPHIQIWNERFQINNTLAKTSQLMNLLNRMEPAIKQVAKSNLFGVPSHFEIQIALAFLYFQEENVDVAVIEVGLGGTIDPTNVLPAKVSVLTSVGFDHMEILGDTIEQIATDKAGIIKHNQTVVSGFSQAEAKKIVKEKCSSEDANLWQLGDNFTYKITDNNLFSLHLPTQKFDNLQVNLKGDFQFSNAACAVAAVCAFIPNTIINEKAVRQGLINSKIPGRMEIAQDSPKVILDGSHTPDQIKNTLEVLKSTYPNNRIVSLISINSNRPVTEILPYIISRSEVIITSEFKRKGFNNAVASKELYNFASNNLPKGKLVIEEKDPITALEIAFEHAQYNDIIWITGSLYLISDIRSYWYPISKILKDIENND